jgi:hypothetical protein
MDYGVRTNKGKFEIAEASCLGVACSQATRLPDGQGCLTYIIVSTLFWLVQATSQPNYGSDQSMPE